MVNDITQNKSSAVNKISEVIAGLLATALWTVMAALLVGIVYIKFVFNRVVQSQGSGFAPTYAGIFDGFEGFGYGILIGAITSILPIYFIFKKRRIALYTSVIGALAIVIFALYQYIYIA